MITAPTQIAPTEYGHHGRRRTLSYAEEILGRVDVTDSGCWLWTGFCLPGGYGQIGRNLLTHRVVWEHLVGPIGEGMTLDHECHNRDLTCNAREKCIHRRCVNPSHISEKTIGENSLAGRTFPALNAAKTHCSAGHEFTEANTYYRPDRYGRMCRRCRYLSGQRYAAAHRARIARKAREYRRAQERVA